MTGHNSDSCLQAIVDSDSSQTVKFYGKVSSQANYDYLQFYIDSTLKDQISGAVGWQQKPHPVSSGIHILLVARPSRPCVAGASRPPGRDGQAHCSAGQRPARRKGNPRVRGGDVIPAKAGMPSPRQDFVQLVAELWTGPSPDCLLRHWTFSARGRLAPLVRCSILDGQPLANNEYPIANIECRRNKVARNTSTASLAPGRACSVPGNGR